MFRFVRKAKVSQLLLNPKVEEGIKTDPMVEVFYKNLIRLYLKMDRLIDAKQVFNRYETLFKQELGHFSVTAMTAIKKEIFSHFR